MYIGKVQDTFLFKTSHHCSVTCSLSLLHPDSLPPLFMGLIASFTFILHQFTEKLRCITTWILFTQRSPLVLLVLITVYSAIVIAGYTVIAEIPEEAQNKSNKYEQPDSQKGCKQANSLCRFPKPFYLDGKASAPIMLLIIPHCERKVRKTKTSTVRLRVTNVPLVTSSQYLASGEFPLS